VNEFTGFWFGFSAQFNPIAWGFNPMKMECYSEISIHKNGQSGRFPEPKYRYYFMLLWMNSQAIG